ncbi:MAG: hypothetical protein R2738_08330 [Bacteroides graminisolvens]
MIQGISPSQKEDIYVLDFFGGSSTTAQAVLELKHQRKNLHFILVQWKVNLKIPKVTLIKPDFLFLISLA